ncbi:MAG TPA: hypothetical protein V6D08_21045 [Candidatus Obscuribacterales bacterium]
MSGFRSCHRYVIELTDYLEGAEARAVGQVDSIDVYNVFNAGVRLYRDGQPNKAEGCWPPIRLSTDCTQAGSIRDMVARLQFPNLDYGDNVDTGNGENDDWMCNSLTSFLLTKAGIDTANPRIRPLGGLTPAGRRAGCWPTAPGLCRGVSADAMQGAAPAPTVRPAAAFDWLAQRCEPGGQQAQQCAG